MAYRAVNSTLPVAAKFLTTACALLWTSAVCAAILFSIATHECPARINSRGGARANDVHAAKSRQIKCEDDTRSRFSSGGSVPMFLWRRTEIVFKFSISMTTCSLSRSLTC